MHESINCYAQEQTKLKYGEKDIKNTCRNDIIHFNLICRLILLVVWRNFN